MDRGEVELSVPCMAHDSSINHSLTHKCKFYRAMLYALCIARTMLSPDVCPFACPSVCHTCALGIVSKRLNISSNFFSRSDSHTIPVFRNKNYGNITTGTPNNGGVNCRVWKNHDFRLTSLIILNMIQDIAYHANRNGTQAFEWYHFQRPSVTYVANRPISSSRYFYSTASNSKMVADIVTMADP